MYGTGREFNGAVTSRHLGTDFAGAVGAPVRARRPRAWWRWWRDFYLAGHAVYLDHGGGLVTGYFHLSRVDVAAGDTVAAGQIIGAVGRSGRATGPHLHWIARYGGDHGGSDVALRAAAAAAVREARDVALNAQGACVTSHAP